MKRSLLIFSVLSLSLATSACTHDNSYPPTQPSSEYRQDGEHKAHHMMTEALFHTIDKDGNGVITRKELDEYTHKWFKEADASHNGKLTFEEFTAQLKREKEKLKQHAHHAHEDDNGDTEEAEHN